MTPGDGNLMSQNRAPLVLFRTRFFGIDPRDQIPDYEWKDRFTSDQSRLNEADAVVFHIPDLRGTPIEATPRRSGRSGWHGAKRAR